MNGISKVISFINGISASRYFFYWFNNLFYKVNSSTNWQFFKQDQNKILWVHICTNNLTGIAISLNKWWKTRYPEYKMRVVSKKEFEQIKAQKK